jgi:hypothetical protein
VGEMFTFCGAEVSILMCLTFYVGLHEGMITNISGFYIGLRS